MGLAVTGVALLAAGRFLAARGEGGSRSGAPPRPGLDAPSLAGAAVAGAAHALGTWPGVSRPAMAAAVLLALGVRPLRAFDLALIATVPFWWADAAAGVGALPALGAGRAIVCALFAFLGAYAAVALLRALVARRAVAVMSAWALPLACALFAYGQAAGGS